MTSVPPAKKRHTCWTLSNYTEQEIQIINKYAEGTRYLCYAKETCPTTNTPHLQGYVMWDTPRSLDKFKKDCGGRLHYEPHTNGTSQQNRNYCMGMVDKKGNTQNPSFVEFGEIGHQGSRTDWAQVIDQLRTTDVTDVIMQQPQLTPCIRALERFKSLQLKPLNRDVKVILLIGKAGTGKSRYAYDNYPNLFSKPDGEWFDGYCGQKTLLLDDFYGGMSYPTLLKVCDRYPFNAAVKGGFVYAQWDTIIITSNIPYQQWYPFRDMSAFRRRITYLDEDYNHALQEASSTEEETQVTLPTHEG